jgi:BirA family biotin operon repressor/biotin-[acetyl-CoA-carboxylase] ligase
MSDIQHLSWGAEALWRRLEPLLPGLSVEVVAHADSTNTQLLERARQSSGRPDGLVTRPGELRSARVDDPQHSTPHGRRVVDLQPCLLVAEYQTRGRGRLGRDWVASAGASLTFSLSLPLAPADWGGLSLAVGLGLAQALDPPPAAPAGGQAGRPIGVPGTLAWPRIGLKWPNDLWILDGPGRGRKLAGILIETVSVGQRRMCVVGVGLNVAPQAIPDLPQGYACLQELDARSTAPGVLARTAEPLVRALLDFEAHGFGPLAAAYARRDLLRGHSVTTTLAELPQGVAEGVDARGALLVRAGSLHHVVSGEVSVRLGDAEA